VDGEAVCDGTVPCYSINDDLGWTATVGGRNFPLAGFTDIYPVTVLSYSPLTLQFTYSTGGGGPGGPAPACTEAGVVTVTLTAVP
jgi:hypothetical protein